MKASYLGAMGWSQRHLFPTTWPMPPGYHDPESSVQSYQDGIAECEFARKWDLTGSVFPNITTRGGLPPALPQ